MGSLPCVRLLDFSPDLLDSFADVLDGVTNTEDRLRPPASCQTVRADGPNQLATSILGTLLEHLAQVDFGGRGKENHAEDCSHYGIEVYTSPDRDGLI